MLFVEGPTDKVILENAWNKLKKEIRMPFKIHQAFDRYHLGNTFTRGDIFKNNSKNIFIGMLDFDEAFENWNRLLEQKDINGKIWEQTEKNSQKGLLLKHKKYNGYVFLLPVPMHREKYASHIYRKMSRLTIELLFEDTKLDGFVDEIEIPGGVKIIKFKDNKKTDFAKFTNDFQEDDFSSFKPIFDIVEKIIDDAKKH